MTDPRPTQRLHVVLAALTILTALSVSAAIMEKPAGPAPNPKVAKDLHAVHGASVAAHSLPAPSTPPPGASPPGQSAGPRSTGSLPAVPPAPSPSAPAASKARTRRGEAVGRPNPFAPPGFAQPPRQSGPSFGLDLPLPPGTVPAAPAAPPPPPPPGAGMTVGAIVGGSERVAIIQEGGQIFVVGVGDKVGDAAVVEIRDDRVVMRKGDVTFELLYPTSAGGQSYVVGVGSRSGEAPAGPVRGGNMGNMVVPEVPYAGGVP